METKDNNDIILIENYLDGKLSKPEEEQFLQRLENDEKFAKLYRFRLKIRDDWQKARQYESVNKEVAGTIRKEKNKKRKTIIYAMAASLAFLVVISGVFSLLNRQPEPSQIIATEEDSTKPESFEPQVKEPASYADSGKYVEEEFLLSHQIKNDSIVLSWRPETEIETEIILIAEKDGEELAREKIEPFSSHFAISQEEIPQGIIIWYLKDIEVRDTIMLQ